MKLPFDKQNFYNSIIEYLFVIVLILNCNTIWTSYSETMLNRILRAAIVFVTAMYIIAGNRISKDDVYKILILGILAIVYLGIYAIIVNYDVMNFLYFLIDVFCIYIFVLIAKNNDRGVSILEEFENIILFLAVISLIFWLFGSILGLIQSTGVVYSTWTGNDSIKEVPSYFNLYFETQNLDGLMRNTGIFTEAPMYNFTLCIALLVELFGRKKISIARCVVLILTILTTFSTTGWCMMVIAIIAKYIFMEDTTKLMQIIKILAVPALIIVGVFVVWVLVTGKLDTGSGNTRADDFAAGYKAWITHPIFGVGMDNVDYVKQFMSSFRSGNLGFSNSPMQILYQGGIFFAIPYIYCIYKWVRVCLCKNRQWLLFFACFLFIFTITVVSYKFLTIFLFMAYEFIGSPETEDAGSEELDQEAYLNSYLSLNIKRQKVMPED